MDGKDIVLQENNKSKRGYVNGFADNPQNINRNGRPKKGQSLSDLMNKYLDTPSDDPDITKKEKFIMKVAKMAYDGDATALKLIWNYLDGMPHQKIDLTSNDQTIMADKENMNKVIVSIIDKLQQKINGTTAETS